jgi:formylglycine-generating enzyme required for sulfatase activity
MKKYILIYLAFLLAACQPAPTAAPEFTPTTAPQQQVEENTPTPAPTETPPSPPTLEPTPTPETVKISPKDGMTQILIPAGTFFMGGMDVHRKNDELPAHEVFISAFWMDQVEVTNGMYQLCVDSGSCRPPAQVRSDNREEYFGNPEFQDFPVVHVTWYDANAYCQWAGRRLPTEAEWERAARGDDKRNFPWGDEFPNEYNANALNFISDTWRVGSFPEGASPFGVLDMAGNVWEWVADRYRPDYYGKSSAENPTGPADDEVFNNLRVIRGGSFQEDGIFMRLANRNSLDGPNPKAQSTDDEYYGRSSVKVGFRCAADQ